MPTIDDLLAPHTPDVQAITRRARELVLATLPGVAEHVQMGWKAIIYGANMRKSPCAIQPYRAHVNLQFSRGADLDDPDGLLEGTGKGMRHVKLRSPEDVDAEKLAPLIRAAAALV